MKIWVNGCFDILHTGHIDLLNYAKECGGELNTVIVGIDSDKRIKELKGEKRPINNQYDRKKMLNNLKMVNTVVVYDTDEELERFILDKGIDFIVVGDHYKNKTVIGASKSRWGVIYYPTDNRSSTNIIEKIKNL